MSEAFRAARRRVDRELAGFAMAEKEFLKLRGQEMSEIPKRPDKRLRVWHREKEMFVIRNEDELFTRAELAMRNIDHEHAVAVAAVETMQFCVDSPTSGEPDEAEYLKSLLRETLKRIENSGWAQDVQDEAADKGAVQPSAGRCQCNMDDCLACERQRKAESENA